MDATQARNASLRLYNNALATRTQAAQLLADAQDANRQWARSGSEAFARQRSALAHQAYNARVNAEVGLMRAAFALVAADAMEANSSTAAVDDTLSTIQQQRTTQLERKTHRDRVDLMQQASVAAQKALDLDSGLPPSLRADWQPPSSNQATVGMKESFRAPADIAAMAHFYPLDIRAASGALHGATGLTLDPETWAREVNRAVETGALNAKRNARELAAKVASKGDVIAQKMAQRAFALAGFEVVEQSLVQPVNEDIVDGITEQANVGVQQVEALANQATPFLQRRLNILGVNVPVWLPLGLGAVWLLRR